MKKEKQNQPAPLSVPLPATGYLRGCQLYGNPKAKPPIPAILPIGRSTFLKKVKSGEYKLTPVRLSERCVAYRVEESQGIAGSFIRLGRVMASENLGAEGLAPKAPTIPATPIHTPISSGLIPAATEPRPEHGSTIRVWLEIYDRDIGTTYLFPSDLDARG